MKNLLAILFFVPGILIAQERPGLFFREDFKETPAEIPINQQHIANPDVLLSLYGPGANVIKKSNHDKPDDDPFYVWSGLCEGNWAIAFKHKTRNVNLSGQSKIRWRSKQSGFRDLHVIIKLADGTWLVSNGVDPISSDWRIREINVRDLHWMTLDIDTVVEKKWSMNPDLSNVEEIGWTDLMIGGGSDACSRVDWIEIDGIAIDRK